MNGSNNNCMLSGAMVLSTSQPQSIPDTSTRLTNQRSSDNSNPPSIHKTDVNKPQRTSVIQSNAYARQRSDIRLPIQRQKSVDETTCDIGNEKKSENVRKDDSCSYLMSSSFDAERLESCKLNNPGFQYSPRILKSKSLEMPDNHLLHSSSLPSMFSKHSSLNYEEEARRYFQSLHITGTKTHHPYSTLHSVSHDSGVSRDSSFSESPTNGSPLSTVTQSNPLRLLTEQKQALQPEHAENYSCSPYETTQNIQHKYNQRKAYSFNTAPYDLIHREKNLRRIFSEELFPGQYHQRVAFVNERRSPVQQQNHMRRAASYDLATYVRHRKLNNTEKISGSVGSFHSLGHQSPIKQASSQLQHTSKIIFPEHDNVKDYKSIFTKPIEDESTLAQKVMESSSFLTNPTSHSANPDFVNYYQNSAKKFQFLEEGNKHKHNQDKIGNQDKLKPQQQTSRDSLVGPYVYDASVDDELAVCVTGLLTLPGSNEKRYPITVGELRRRIAPPEYLNKVDMISYVRLAKTSARELLEKHAIRPKHHSRKSKHSIISKMCEAECTELANGIKTLGEAYFPKDWLSKQAIGRELNHIENEAARCTKLEERRKKLESTKEILSDLVSMLKSNKDCNAMQNYNLATHSYGVQNLVNNIELVTSIIDAQTSEISCTIGTKLPNHKQLNGDPANQITVTMTPQRQISLSRKMSIDSIEMDEQNDERPRL